MAYIQSFSISTTTTLANVESLTTTPNMAPRSKPFAYQEAANMASGVDVGRGSPSCVWYWGYVPTDLFAALRTICPGASASVYIRTLSEDYSTYAYYQARMHWPAIDAYEFRAGVYQPFQVEFTHLVAWTPPS